MSPERLARSQSLPGTVASVRALADCKGAIDKPDDGVTQREQVAGGKTSALYIVNGHRAQPRASRLAVEQHSVDATFRNGFHVVQDRVDRTDQ